LPKENHVQTERFRLFGFYRPADQASGDWWYYAERNEGQHLILVGDVTGHGPGPAMVTAAAGTAFRVAGRDRDLAMQERLTLMNDEVLSVGQGKYQMTMSAVELDDETGRFIMYSAGGLPVLVLSRSGKPTVVGTRGTMLGSSDFKTGTVQGQLKPGDRMIIFTDGIPELNLANGRLLGMREFTKIFERTRSVALPDAAQQIVRDADAARGTIPQMDDWTFTIIEFVGDGIVPDALLSDHEGTDVRTQTRPLG
jgi:serine phosphatase RsbU (regulator of sigma subunit)